MQAEAQTMMDTKHSAISVIKGGPTSTNHTLPMNGKTLAKYHRWTRSAELATPEDSSLGTQCGA
jgi:hypothetical protein